MIAPQKPANEAERLAALHEYDLLDTLPEEQYDAITRIASEICAMPISVISLIDSDRQWFKSTVGLDAKETPREQAFCAHAILKPDEMLVVNDSSQDERFHDNPLVKGVPHISFYTGVPLVNNNGLPLGTLCVMDTKPNKLTPEQQVTLKALASQVVAYFELQRKNRELASRKLELERLNQELERFAYVAAHDLKSPCNSLIMLSQALEEMYGEMLDEGGKEMLEMLGMSATTLTGLVDGILQHTREVNMEIKKELFDFGHLAEELKRILHIPKSFSFSYDAPKEELFAPRHALLQVMLNLCVNAIKYNDKKEGTLHIAAKDEGSYYYFEVKDNGAGIPESQFEKIFELYATLGTQDRDNKRGYGIGLSTVKRLVEKLGGEIGVISEIGKGSTFYFTIPK